MTDSDIEQFHRIMESPESESDPVVPVESFTLDGYHLGNAARMTAHNWGLEVRRNPLNPAALLDVLGARFSYWSDDVEHEPIFEP